MPQVACYSTNDKYGNRVATFELLDRLHVLVIPVSQPFPRHKIRLLLKTMHMCVHEVTIFILHFILILRFSLLHYSSQKNVTHQHCF